jgi:hypothetical protein
MPSKHQGQPPKTTTLDGYAASHRAARSRREDALSRSGRRASVSKQEQCYKRTLHLKASFDICKEEIALCQTRDANDNLDHDDREIGGKPRAFPGFARNNEVHNPKI